MYKYIGILKKDNITIAKVSSSSEEVFEMEMGKLKRAKQDDETGEEMDRYQLEQIHKRLGINCKHCKNYYL